MFRRGLFGRLPDWYFKVWADDWPLFVLNAVHGRTGYIDEVMATYRIHAGGWWQRLNRIDRQLKSLEIYDAMNEHFAGRFCNVIRLGKAECCYNLAMAYEVEGDLRKARHYALQCLRMQAPAEMRSAAHLARLLVRTSMPRLYNLARGLRRAKTRS
jgi:hypothetical protein